ncbi:MAG: DUF4416 family protein [Candidatus Magnetominusculus sp. LBB02]|nr:DUF4416 family protein [Candidatus Magnetominusculus sp. LBB02]
MPRRAAAKTLTVKPSPSGLRADSEDSLLFAGVLYTETYPYELFRDRLVELFCPIRLESEPRPWDYSEYYNRELGSPIMRRFIIFDTLIRSETLPDIKLKAIALEKSLSLNGRRRYNIDPGYITLSKLVLATTKNYSHRIHLRDGIYAEVTLLYRGSSYVPNCFTYHDYSETDSVEFFKQGRALIHNSTVTSYCLGG